MSEPIEKLINLQHIISEFTKSNNLIQVILDAKMAFNLDIPIEKTTIMGFDCYVTNLMGDGIHFITPTETYKISIS